MIGKTFIVMPGAKQLYKPGSDYVICDTKDFTFDWCCRNIAGFQFQTIQIWQSDDHEAIAYALSRLRYKGDVSLLVSKLSWERYKEYCKEFMSDEVFDNFAESVNVAIVEDLKW